MRFLKNKLFKVEHIQSLPEIQVKIEAPDDYKQKELLPEKILVKQEHPIMVKQESIPCSIPKKKPVAKAQPSGKGKRSQTKGSPGPKKDVQANKNIVKNYARAMVNFALSDMALSYLRKFCPQVGCEVKEFRVFLAEQKEDINSIKTLRDVLLICNGDDQQTIKLKRVFREISEVFVKFFSVNWIFNSKVSDKKLHLKYRFKLLRRVRNPEHFTYLENFGKTR